MKQFTYIHFSDLHIGSKLAKPLFSHIKSELWKDIDYIVGELGNVDAIFMTGDLVQCGSSDEYASFEEFMNTVIGLLKQKGSNPVVFFVPGNHDLERISDDSDPVHQVLKNWIGNTQLKHDIFWNKPQYIGYCNDRFKNYLDFVKRYTNIPVDNTKYGIIPGDFCSNIEINGIKIGVIGLNSSFLQIEGGDFRGKLGVYLNQIESLFGGKYVEALCENDLNFLLTHHNSDWYEPESKNDYNGEIYLKDHILEHLCGHNHQPKTEYVNINFTGESRVSVGPSLCGLEYFDGNIERIHGYQAGKIIINDNGSIVKHFYPRLAVKRGSSFFFDRDFNYQCEKGKEYAIVSLRKEDDFGDVKKHPAAEISDILLGDKPQTGSIHLHPSTIHGGQAYNSVRLQEQKLAETYLSKTRILWLNTSFGLGEEQFLYSVFKNMNIDLQGVYIIDSDDITSYIGLDKLVREHFSISINNLIDELSIASKSPVLIFRGISRELIERDLASLSTMASSMTKYNENIKLIFISSEMPEEGYFNTIHLQPLSKSDIKHFVEESMPSKQFTSFDIDKIIDFTNGYPICLDIIIKQLEYAELDDLNEADFSFSQDELRIPKAISDYIKALMTSSQKSERNMYSLLVLLSLLPKGDTYSSIKRYQTTSPYRTIEVDSLKSYGLITIDHYYVIKNHSLISSIDVLRIPKIFRDFILSLESNESLRDKNSIICEMYLGNTWINGNISLKKTKGDAYYPFIYYNIEAAICSLLHYCIDSKDNNYFTRYLTVAGNYLYELEQQHLYYVALYVGDTFYQLVKDHVPEEAERTFSFLKFELADMKRMNGYYEDSEELFLSVLEENKLSKSQMQTSRECLGLLYSKRGEKERALYYANELLNNEKYKSSSIYALTSRYLKALNEDDEAKRLKEMKTIYRKACNDSKYRSISANTAREIAKLEPSEQSLCIVDRELKKLNISYQWMQLIQCKYNIYTHPSMQITLNDTDIEFVRKVYSYSFAQMIIPMMNNSHRILWNYYLKKSDYQFLANMLRHSIYVWELNNEYDKIKFYINELKNNNDFLKWIQENILRNEDALSLDNYWCVSTQFRAKK